MVAVNLTIELVVAAVSAVISLVAGVVSARANHRAKEFEYHLEQRRRADDEAAVAQRVLRQYRDPLLDAANTLQSRIYNIVAQNYLGSYLHCGDPDEERYAREYTVFALAEYLTWVEILRRELRFLDLGDERHNRELMERITRAQVTIQSDRISGPFQVFRGRQRAIAEVMMVPTGATEGPRSECVGYATFTDRLEEDEDFRVWFDRPLREVDLLTARGHDQRLVQLQNDLVDLIDHLDPNGLRVPLDYRRRLSQPTADGIPAQAAR
jgi:hypothetical protein